MKHVWSTPPSYCTLISWNHYHGSGTIPLKGFIRNIVSSFTTVNKYCIVVAVGLKKKVQSGFKLTE
jgi:hypothetical protein